MSQNNGQNVDQDVDQSDQTQNVTTQQNSNSNSNSNQVANSTSVLTYPQPNLNGNPYPISTNSSLPTLGTVVIRSFNLPPYTSIDLYPSLNFTGIPVNYSSTSSNLDVYSVPIDVQSLKVSPIQPPANENYVQLFTDQNFSSNQTDYPVPSANPALNLGVQSLYSIPLGTTVTLYTLPNYQGQSIVYNAPFSDTNDGVHVVLDNTFSGNVKSIKVVDLQQPSSATGGSSNYQTTSTGGSWNSTIVILLILLIILLIGYSIYRSSHRV